MEGWKVHILGIGSSTAAREIAKELAGTYTEVTDTPTKEEMEEQTVDFLGIVEQSEPISLSSVGRRGATSLSFSLLSSGYPETRAIVIDAIRISGPDGSEQDLIKQPVKITIESGEEKSIKLPATFSALPGAGEYDAIITFGFVGDTTFSPASSPVTYRVKGFLGNYFWIIPAGALVIAAVVMLLLLLARSLSGGGSIRFGCAIGGGVTRKKDFKIKYSEALYLVEGSMGLSINSAPGKVPAAEIRADSEGLHLSILDKSGYTSISDIPIDVMGKEVTLVKKTGKKVPIAFTPA